MLDVDGDEGLATLADLEDRNGWLPVGPASITGSGGDAPAVRRQCPRREQCQACWARARYPSGRRLHRGTAAACTRTGTSYRWLDGRDPWAMPLPEVPGWLLDLLDPPRPAYRPPPRSRRPTTGYVATAMARELEAVAMAGQGQRNQTLNTAAYKLGRFVASGELDARDVGEALVGVALAAGLNEREATRTVTSGLRAAVERARMMADTYRLRGHRACGGREEAARQEQPKAAAGKWFRFPWEFEPAKAPRLVKGLMAHGDEVLVYGPPEAGKTFFPSGAPRAPERSWRRFLARRPRAHRPCRHGEQAQPAAQRG